MTGSSSIGFPSRTFPGLGGISTTHGTESESGDELLGAIAASAARAEFRDFMASLPISLTPSAIVAMLQRRMNGLDSQISTRITEMEGQQAHLNELQGKAEILLAVQAAANRDGNIYSDKEITIDGEKKTVEQWIALTGVQLEKVDPGTSTPWYTSAALSAATKTIESQIKQANQGNELRMMDLQSLMQQRSSEISLATNMLKAVQEGTDAIVRNMA
jgi:hypothetical protein